MKITKAKLKQIIQEELENLLEMPMGMETKAPAKRTAAEASMHYSDLQRDLKHEKGKYPIDNNAIAKINAQIEALKSAHPNAGGTGPTGRK